MAIARSKNEKRGSFTLWHHYNMVCDKNRVKPFRKAINKVVTSKDIVLDAGTGVGILAIFASKKAKKVYAIEKDTEVADIAAYNFNIRDYHKNIFLIVGDMMRIDLLRSEYKIIGF